ncbi:MAG: hypothetical protein AAFR54_11390 [Planctomycetota bacterium]
MMHEVLTPLTQAPGVKQAAVISADGVPVCVLERSSLASGEFVDCTNSSQPALEGQRIDPASLVALAASWVDDVMRAGGQIAWELPKRFVLRASQGTLVVQQGPNAHVMVVLEPSIEAESFALPLEVAVERLHRLLRDLGRFDPEQSAGPLPSAQPDAQNTFTAPSVADYAAGAQGAPTDSTGAAPSGGTGPNAETRMSAPFDAPGDN